MYLWGKQRQLVDKGNLITSHDPLVVFIIEPKLTIKNRSAIQNVESRTQNVFSEAVFTLV